MSFIEPSVDVIVGLISSISYAGLAILMALDATIFPVPSAVVLGFAGYLCFLGRFDLATVTFAGAFGSMLGSVSMYAISRWGGKPLLDRYGRYLGLDKKRMSRTEIWFKRHGNYAVFLAQMLPVFRDLIPFPAGLARMKLGRFAALSFLGSIPFCLALSLVGLLFGSEWQAAVAVLDEYDIWLVLFASGLLIIYFVLKRRRRSKSNES